MTSDLIAKLEAAQPPESVNTIERAFFEVVKQQLIAIMREELGGDVTVVPNPILSSMLLCAFRYSLGRMTYITSECAGWLRQYWHIMPPAWQRQIQEDTRRAIDTQNAGHACDIAAWKTVLDLPTPKKEQPHD